MGPSPAAAEESAPSVAVEVARLTGRIDQVIVDHERRLAALEARAATGGTKAAAIAAPWIAVAGLLVVVVSKVQWL
jgi:hypothetical protein